MEYRKRVFSFVIIVVSLSVTAHGRPQFNFGGVHIQDGAERPFPLRPLIERHGKEIRDALDRHGITGLVQSFLGRDRSGPGKAKEESGLEIRENDSSIQPAPLAPSEGTGGIEEVEPSRSSKCNDDELMFEADGKCYKKGSVTVGIDSPCIDDFYEFKARDDKSGYGECQCAKFRGTTTRPVVNWTESNRCYWLYDQGPCSSGQWLVPGGEHGLMCTQRSCPENPEEEKVSAFPNFWFEHKGKCYKTGTQDPEFCDGNENLKIYFSNDKPEPVCLERRPIPEIRALAGDKSPLACRGGQKQLQNGECKRIALFD